MSRYSKTVIGEHSIEFTINYGHDHASGYFVQVYHKSNPDPIVEINKVFGLQYWAIKVPEDIKEAATKLAQTTIERIRNVEIPVERMDYNTKTHLGARIAKDFRKVFNLPNPD